MLASKATDLSALKYPLFASYKLDGVRAFISEGNVWSRKFKPIPNKYVQEKFSKLPSNLDGELILGDPTAKDCYRKTMSAVMSHDDEAGKEVEFYVFDKVLDRTFSERYNIVKVECGCKVGVVVVEQKMIYSVEELLAFEEFALEQGHEGIMVRSIDGIYKHGRSTVREGWLLKVKRFEDSEAVVLGSMEFQHNTNEAFKDELGHTKRSTAKAGKVGAGMLGKLLVRDCKTGVEFEIGTGFDFEERKSLWDERESLVGRIAKYKHFPSGSKDRPRFPVFLGWRNPIDR